MDYLVGHTCREKEEIKNQGTPNVLGFRSTFFLCSNQNQKVSSALPCPSPVHTFGFQAVLSSASRRPMEKYAQLTTSLVVLGILALLHPPPSIYLLVLTVQRQQIEASCIVFRFCSQCEREVAMCSPHLTWNVTQ